MRKNAGSNWSTSSRNRRSGSTCAPALPDRDRSTRRHPARAALRRSHPPRRSASSSRRRDRARRPETGNSCRRSRSAPACRRRGPQWRARVAVRHGLRRCRMRVRHGLRRCRMRPPPCRTPAREEIREGIDRRMIEQQRDRQRNAQRGFELRAHVQRHQRIHAHLEEAEIAIQRPRVVAEHPPRDRCCPPAGACARAATRRSTPASTARRVRFWPLARGRGAAWVRAPRRVEQRRPISTTATLGHVGEAIQHVERAIRGQRPDADPRSSASASGNVMPPSAHGPSSRSAPAGPPRR